MDCTTNAGIAIPKKNKKTTSSDFHLKSYYDHNTALHYFQLCESVQSTVVISKSKGLSEILRDIQTSTYQICRIEEKINRTTTFHKLEIY